MIPVGRLGVRGRGTAAARRRPRARARRGRAWSPDPPLHDRGVRPRVRLAGPPEHRDERRRDARPPQPLRVRGQPAEGEHDPARPRDAAQHLPARRVVPPVPVRDHAEDDQEQERGATGRPTQGGVRQPDRERPQEQGDQPAEPRAHDLARAEGQHGRAEEEHPEHEQVHAPELVDPAQPGTEQGREAERDQADEVPPGGRGDGRRRPPRSLADGRWPRRRARRRGERPGRRPGSSRRRCCGPGCRPSVGRTGGSGRPPGRGGRAAATRRCGHARGARAPTAAARGPRRSRRPRR